MDGKPLNEKRAFTIAEAAEYACVSSGTVYNWMHDGILPYEELPGAGEKKYKFRRIRRAVLDDFLNGCQVSASGKKHDPEKLEVVLLPKDC